MIGGAWQQDAYEIRATSALDTVWESGVVETPQSTWVPWGGRDLRSRERITVAVRARSGRVWTDWSSSEYETALFDPADWTATPIAAPDDDGTREAPPVMRFAREFDLTAAPHRARLYITAHGIHAAEINGQPVSDIHFAPGWTSYPHRLLVHALDVTDLLQPGRNAIGCEVADGWYRGNLFVGGNRNVYGNTLLLLAQLEVSDAAGHLTTIGTDDAWTSTPGPRQSADFYNGERFDARHDQPGWSMPGTDRSTWRHVAPTLFDRTTLTPADKPPVRTIEERSPIATTRSASGATIFDFGQNLVGRVRCRVATTTAAELTLRHAEVLDRGELCTAPLRSAEATDRLVVSANESRDWEPRFTFHGFRYAELDAPDGAVDPDSVSAVVLHSDLRRTGSFECSDPLVNRLHDNVVWSLRGNTVDIPTDCPQRDERLGWTGDIQVFAPTAAFLYDVDAFLASWLVDLAAEQRADGALPFVIPNWDERFVGTAVGWGDAAVVVPWTLFERYGDADVLDRQFASMTAWVDAVAAGRDDAGIVRAGWQFGDWLDPDAPHDKAWAAKADRHLVATAYLVRAATIVSSAAEVLGRDADVERFGALASSTTAAFRREFVTASGRIVSDCQTAYALAIVFDLLAPEQVEHAGARLVELVRGNRYRIGTGFLGTPLICDALTTVGRVDVAYRLLLERGVPSFLYPVVHGATTIWERWDALAADGSLNSTAEMTSFNHYAFGAVADWLHRVVAGLVPDAPGYRRVRCAPQPGGGIRSATAALDTVYGTTSVAWRLDGDQLRVEVAVPANATASVVPPDGIADPVDVADGRHSFHWTVPAATLDAWALIDPPVPEPDP